MENHFTDQNFKEEVLDSAVPVFIDFWAPWCTPCRAMGPIIEELAGEIDPSRLKIGKVNVDENGKVAMEYRILSIPTFMIFEGGKVVDQFSGAMDKESLKSRLAKYL